jgi:acyl dehydratase
MKTTLPSIDISRDELADYIGKSRTADTWLKITQPMINAFADATFDHQFIHVDPERARQSPFGTTVAHGFFTLSLLPKLLESVPLTPQGVVMGVNYGLNRVRFPSPVKVDSEIRAVMTLLDVAKPAADRVLMTSEVVVQIKGEAKPAVIAESLALLVFG